MIITTFCTAAFSAQTPLLEVHKIPLEAPCYITEDETSDVITLTFAFKTSGEVTQKYPGLLNVLVLMLKEGTEDMDQRAFKKYLLDHNIETSFGFTRDHLTLTFRTTKNTADEMFVAVKKILLSPRFQKDDFKKVKDQVLSDLSQQSHMPELKAKEAFEDFILKDHPYNIKNSQRIKTIRELKVEDLKEAWKKCTSKERLVIAVSGGVTKEIKEKLTQFVSGLNLASGEALKTDKIYSLHNIGKSHHVHEDIPQTIIMFGLPSLDRQHPDFYALSFALHAFASGYFETRLMKEIREKRGLAYGCGAAMVSNLFLKMIYGKTATNTKNVPEVINIIKTELKKLVKNGLTKEEFTFHQGYLAGKAPLMIADTLSINGQIISAACDGISPQDHINNLRARYQNLSLDTVNAVIKKHMHPEQLTIVCVGR